MLELPEVLTLAGQINSALAGRNVLRVLKPTKAGRFCFYNGDPALYDEKLRGAVVKRARGFGIFMEIEFSTGMRLCVNDGVRLTLEKPAAPKGDYQLYIEFDGQVGLSFSIVMYGGVFLHDGSFDNSYYLRSKEAESILSPDIGDYFFRVIGEVKPSMSAKAFIATEQRFAGLGNGCCQDVLFNAGLTPKHKVGDMSPEQRLALLNAMTSTLEKMTREGGRDTEKDLYGSPGGYETLMSRNRAACPKCGGPITKETYLGGSVYYCKACQK